MIVLPRAVLFNESKFDTSEGRNGVSGNQQFGNQAFISALIQKLIPVFKVSVFMNTVLDIGGEKGLSWVQVTELIQNTEVEEFTQKCLAQLRN